MRRKLLQRRVAAPADSTKIDVTTEVEIQRQFNDLRSELLDDRAESITWWLAIVAVLFTLWGLVIAIGGLIGYREFRELRDEARRIVEEIKGDKKQIDELSDQISQGFGDPDRSARTSAAEIQQDAGESQLDAAIADAYSLEEAGNIEAAIEKWCSIANDTEKTDSELAARAWISVGYLLREKDKNDTE